MRRRLAKGSVGSARIVLDQPRMADKPHEKNSLPTLDSLDEAILERLRRNARETIASIGDALGKPASTISRRLAKLEDTGVITGYTVAINHELYDRSVEAYVELAFLADADVHAILKEAMKRPEVREAVTLAGDMDALVRLRVADLAGLRRAVMVLRGQDAVTASKTRIVLGRHWHGHANQDGVDTV